MKVFFEVPNALFFSQLLILLELNFLNCLEGTGSCVSANSALLSKTVSIKTLRTVNLI